MAVQNGSVARIPTDKATGERRGFFFIKPDDGGADVFGHARSLQQTGKAFNDLAVGDRVQYTEIEGEKGPRAVDVRVL